MCMRMYIILFICMVYMICGRVWVPHSDFRERGASGRRKAPVEETPILEPAVPVECSRQVTPDHSLNSMHVVLFCEIFVEYN
jgi:hypothetical protein